MTGNPAVPTKMANHTWHSLLAIIQHHRANGTTENGGTVLVLSLQMSYWEQKST